MHLQSNNTEGTGSINVMSTCYPGKHNDTLCQILKFKIWVKLSTAAYA